MRSCLECVRAFEPACLSGCMPARQRACAYLCVREGMPAYLLGLLPPAHVRLRVGACVCTRRGAPVPLREHPRTHVLGQKSRALASLQASVFASTCACYRLPLRKSA